MSIESVNSALTNNGLYTAHTLAGHSWTMSLEACALL